MDVLDLNFGLELFFAGFFWNESSAWFLALRQLILIATADYSVVRIVLIVRFHQPLLPLVAMLREGHGEAPSGCNSKDLHCCRPLAHPADSPLFAAERVNRCDSTKQHNLSCNCKQLEKTPSCWRIFPAVSC